MQEEEEEDEVSRVSAKKVELCLTLVYQEFSLGLWVSFDWQVIAATFDKALKKKNHVFT